MGAGLQNCAFFTVALDGGTQPVSTPADLAPKKASRYRQNGKLRGPHSRLALSTVSSPYPVRHPSRYAIAIPH